MSLLGRRTAVAACSFWRFVISQESIVRKKTFVLWKKYFPADTDIRPISAIVSLAVFGLDQFTPVYFRCSYTLEQSLLKVKAPIVESMGIHSSLASYIYVGKPRQRFILESIPNCNRNQYNSIISFRIISLHFLPGCHKERPFP